MTRKQRARSAVNVMQLMLFARTPESRQVYRRQLQMLVRGQKAAFETAKAVEFGYGPVCWVKTQADIGLSEVQKQTAQLGVGAELGPQKTSNLPPV